MFDSNIAIGVMDVSRMFKRYRHPRYRVLEAFGLPLRKGAYDEFWALRGISFELERGDSLGLIGQNGAGKSTLLNIVCGRLQPSSGSVTVRGNVQALMELGTGFHPEFSGRANILSSLAYQGVTGREARRLLDAIVDFSELAEFIDQPLKTYSTGMYARLAFSTATEIVPDILIIDEVLGAGDAYFAAKCVERMHRLTKELGATVLFVSHDTVSVQRMCNRAIWLDRGQIRMTADTLTIAKAYHAWVLERDEERLRAETSRSVFRLRAGTVSAGGDWVGKMPLTPSAPSQPSGPRTPERSGLMELAPVCDASRPSDRIDPCTLAQAGDRAEAVFLETSMTTDRHRGAGGQTLTTADLGSQEGPAPGDLGPRDKWDTEEARFLEVWPCSAATSARKHIFSRGENIVLRLVAEIFIDLPSLWVVAVVYDSSGNRIAVLAERVDYCIPAGVHEFLLTVKQPTIRQGEYVSTVELLPELDFYWNGKGRLPYLCMWDRRLHFKVDEDYQGTVNMGLVYLPAALTHNAVAAGPASIEPRISQTGRSSSRSVDDISRSC
jgi:ABC-type polysaccharide/polyol phosphate transport system ATPase subunit